MISSDQIDSIAERVSAKGCDESVVGELRKEFPALHFTYCMDDDICSAQPCHEGKDFNLYLVDSREHCLGLTQSHEVASGLVIAEIIDE